MFRDEERIILPLIITYCYIYEVSHEILVQFYHQLSIKAEGYRPPPTPVLTDDLHPQQHQQLIVGLLAREKYGRAGVQRRVLALQISSVIAALQRSLLRFAERFQNKKSFQALTGVWDWR